MKSKSLRHLPFWLVPFAFILTIMIVGCSDDTNEFDVLDANHKLNSETDLKSKLTDLQTLDCDKSTCTDVLCYIKDEEDKQNNAVNLELYNQALLVKKAVKDKGTLCKIFDALNNERGESVAVSVSDLLGTKEQNLTYNSDVYTPSLYFLNKPKTCDAKSDVTILISQEVNDCDEVAGWRGDKVVLMGEEEVLRSDEIIIFVGIQNIKDMAISNQLNDDTIIKNVPMSGFNLPMDQKEVSTQKSGSDFFIDIDIVRVQIKNGYRYEKSRHSEVRGFYKPSTSTQSFKKLINIKNIHKKDIKDSKSFNIFNHFRDQTLSSYENTNSNLGAYEYDWYAWPKSVTSSCSGWTTNLQMKFSHEYYFKQCGTPPIINLGTWTVDNYKCSFDFESDILFH